jgi:pyrrolidone-carboxylate peptidase
MSSILLTGFESFANWQVNPTVVAAQQINGMQIGSHELTLFSTFTYINSRLTMQ